jgi:histidine triad (HIT) family protein
VSECIFCKIIGGQLEGPGKIFEDGGVFVMLDVDWAVKGHTLIIWKKHVENASDLSKEDFLHFSDLVFRTEKGLLKELGAERSMILKSGGIVSHFHFHIYPLVADTDWETKKAILEKRVRYEPKPNEEKELIDSLRPYFPTV